MVEVGERKESSASAPQLIARWQEISDRWLEPDPEARNEPQLREQEDAFLTDLQYAVDAGQFSEEDKAALKEALAGAGVHHADNGLVDERIQQLVEGR